MNRKVYSETLVGVRPAPTAELVSLGFTRCGAGDYMVLGGVLLKGHRVGQVLGGHWIGQEEGRAVQCRGV